MFLAVEYGKKQVHCNWFSEVNQMNIPFGLFDLMGLLYMIGAALLYIAVLTTLILLIRRLLADEKDRKMKRQQDEQR